MIRVLIAVTALIVGAVAAGAYFDFDPTVAIMAILGLGIFLLGRCDDPPLPSERYVHWGSGHGLYFSSSRDRWVEGRGDGAAGERRPRA
jgi:hypothetical protein